MSKRWIGKKRYECGSRKFTYFRITKHHRIKRNGYTRLRWMMYCAKENQSDIQINKSLNNKK